MAENILLHTLAAAAQSLQSCPTLCNPIDSSPPGFPVPGILQARTLEWVAISFSTPLLPSIYMCSLKGLLRHWQSEQCNIGTLSHAASLGLFFLLFCPALLSMLAMITLVKHAGLIWPQLPCLLLSKFSTGLLKRFHETPNSPGNTFEKDDPPPYCYLLVILETIFRQESLVKSQWT